MASEDSRATVIASSTAATRLSLWRVSTMTPAAPMRSSAPSIAFFAPAEAAAQPPVCRKARLRGLFAAAGRALRVPRIARRARKGGGEFGCHRLADHDGASRAQRRDRGGIAPGLRALEQRRALPGRHVYRLDDVLDADRHAVDRRERLAVAPAFCRAIGGGTRALAVLRDE